MFPSSAPGSHSLVRRIALAASMVALSAFSLPALAQAPPQDSSSLSDKDFVTEDLASLSLAPAPSPQYGENGPRRRYPPRAAYQSHWSRLAVEGGGGFTAPIGNSQADLTYGWNFRGGLGYKFSRDLSLMAEYEFDRNKIPGATLSQVGEPGGNVHTWSLTLDPVLYYKTTGAWGGYITGGGGFYRKLTSFTEPALAIGEYCDFFFCYPYQFTTNVTVSHFSSNQFGANLGTGFTFGAWNGAKFYTEARYEWLNTPGRGTQMIPVTFGLRF
jgi:hypothetical protein